MEFENYSIDYLLLIFTFIMGLLSIIIFINNPINIVKGERFIGAYSNSNQLGFWAFISFIISFKYLKNKIIIVNILLELVLIILAGSRSVFIATSFFVIYTLFKKVDFKSPKNIYVFLMSIVFFVLLIIITTFTRYQWLYKYIKDMEFKEILNTLSGYRYYIWKEVLEIFYKFPIFGIGPNNVNNAAKLVLAENSMLITGGWEDPHNIVIALLTYTGLIGTLLFIKILYDKFKVIIENKSDYLLISIICLLVISLFDIGIVFDNRILSVYFWYLIGQANLMRYKNDEEN
jgi:O-antigen ligase